MTLPTHHPGDDLLVDYAGGGLCESAALLVATHTALCPTCRRTVSELEAVGGGLMEALEPDPVTDRCCLQTMMRRLDEAGEPPPPSSCRKTAGKEPAEAPPASCGGSLAPLPQPLRAYVARHGAGLRWRTRLPGLHTADLPTGCGRPARLVRLEGGKSVPRHSHEGIELALVLDGGFTDAFGHFRRGDVAVGDDSIEHTPVADAGGCLCLSVTLGRLRLTGPIGRLVDRFIRF